MTKMSENRISELFFNQPLAIHQDMIGPISAIIDRHIEGVKLSDLEIDAAIGSRDRSQTKGYEVINGVAIIPIVGVISKRMNIFSRISGGVSVEMLQKDFIQALDDPQVKKIAFDIDSPGGTVGGVPELADVIYESRGVKPIESYVNGQMCSAAYWIGSAADKIYTTKSSVVGSIGVYTVAQDYTVMDHNRGIKIEVISAGKHKAVGHPDKHLSRDDISIIQARINDFYELFIDAVERNRSISREKAYELGDGTVSIGQKAVDAGLADGMAVLDPKVIGDSSGTYAEDKPLNINADNEKNNEGDTNMSKEIKDLTLTELQAANPELVKQIQDSTIDQLALNEETVEAKVAEAVKNEKERAAQILGLTKNEAYSGFGELAAECVEKGDSFEVAEGKFKDSRIKVLEKTAPETPGPGEENAGGDKDKTHLDKAKEYAAENKCSLADALSATAEKRKR